MAVCPHLEKFQDAMSWRCAHCGARLTDEWMAASRAGHDDAEATYRAGPCRRAQRRGATPGVPRLVFGDLADAPA